MGMDSQRQVVRVGGPDPSAHPPLKPSSASPPNLGHEQSITVNTLTTPSPPFIALSSEQRPLKVDGQRISLKRPSEPKQLPSTEDFYRSNGPYPATLAEDALSPRTDGRERQPPSNEDMYTDDEPSSTEKGRRILQSESDMNRLSQNVAVQAGKLGFDRDFPLRIQTHLPTFPLVARPMEETDGTMASPAGDQEVAVASSVQKPVDSGGGKFWNNEYEYSQCFRNANFVSRWYGKSNKTRPSSGHPVTMFWAGEPWSEPWRIQITREDVKLQETQPVAYGFSMVSWSRVFMGFVVCGFVWELCAFGISLFYLTRPAKAVEFLQ